jgi:hypothetical protein
MRLFSRFAQIASPARNYLFVGILLFLLGLSPAFATQALDGSVQNSATTGTSFTLALTTTGGSGVIVVFCQDEQGGSPTVTATGLTLTNRVPASSNVGGLAMTEWTVPYTTNFSGTITYTNTAGFGGFAACFAFGISGSSTTSYFDPNLVLLPWILP